jgi:hypothetical protein
VSERDHFNFGWGRRICPGIYLVNKWTHIFLISILIDIYIRRPKLKSLIVMLIYFQDVLLSPLVMIKTSQFIRISMTSKTLVSLLLLFITMSKL